MDALCAMPWSCLKLSRIVSHCSVVSTIRTYYMSTHVNKLYILRKRPGQQQQQGPGASIER